MGIFKRHKEEREQRVTRLQLVTERGNGFYEFGGNIYKSDVVRACMRPKVKAIGKLCGRHIREAVRPGETMKVNPEPYMRFLLEEPNPHMTGQKLQEKLAGQLMLNNNAFALIMRDENGYPTEIYPITAEGVEAAADRATGELLLRFFMQNGRAYTFAYRDVIHLRSDYLDNDIFGEPIAQALRPLMNVVATTDQGVVNAIKNSAKIQWILKYNHSMQADDLVRNAQDFAENYLSIESKNIGVAATDTKAELVEVTPHEYVPNATQMDRTTERIYAIFNTNKKIVQSAYTEDEWNSYYESEIEPVAIDLAGEYTRKLFSRRERGYGNRIVFEASNLQCASIGTKLNLVQLVDRGAMTPNEWRAALGLAPIEGGDAPIRRLDTAVVEPAGARENAGKDGAGGDGENA